MRWGEGAKAVKHDMNFCNFFNLISLTISSKALLYLKVKGFPWHKSRRNSGV